MTVTITSQDKTSRQINRELREAIAVLNLDSQPPEEALKEVKAHPQISSLSVVNLPPAGELPPWLG